MKFALMCSFFIISTFASATTLLVHETRSSDFFGDYDSFFYGVNAELGRAWGLAYETDNRWDESVRYETKLTIPGLSYDNAREAVVFKNGTETIECAVSSISGKWIFKHHVLKETGRCYFEIREVTKTHDDGFNTQKVKYSQIFFTAE